MDGMVAGTTASSQIVLTSAADKRAWRAGGAQRGARPRKPRRRTSRRAYMSIVAGCATGNAAARRV